MCYLKLLLLLLLEMVVRGCSIVQTNIGPVQGKMVKSGKVEAFLGVPYAEPPIGPLRLSKPVSKTPWREIYNATRLPRSCIQAQLKGIPINTGDHTSEDCLYLNLWVPRSNSTDAPKTIMLFIYGGGFVIGGSGHPMYDGANLAQYGDVIVVTINYRVGGLGFLTDFSDEAPGSVGLYDQVMAIEWIKKNAKHFNGDLENIVLFGESAGAWSVSLHQISPLSRNLFKRAILQSGSAVSPNYDDNNAEIKRVNQMYANFSGCKYANDTLGSNTEDFIGCLRKLPAEKFSEIDLEVYLKRNKYPIPRVGNDFLPQSTIDAFRKGQFNDSEVLMGITRNEGFAFIIGLIPDLHSQFDEKAIESMFNETTAYNVIKTILNDFEPAEVDKIIRGYIDNVKDDIKYTYVEAISDAVGDYIITCGNVFQAEYQSLKGIPVFFYVFDHRPVSSPYPEWMGVAHGDDLQFVFGNPMYKNLTESEVKLSRDVMNMWATFAKTGSPKELGWLKYTFQHPNYFIIGKPDSVGFKPDKYRCDRWRNLYRSVIDEDLIETLKRKS